MKERTGKGRLSLFFAFCLFLLPNVFLPFFPDARDSLKERDRFVWSRKIRELRGGRSSPVDLLFLGDSQVMSGLLPGVWKEEQPGSGSVRNLALPSFQPEGIEALMPEILESGTKRIIVNLGPYSLFETDNTRAFFNYYHREMPLDSLMHPERGRSVFSLFPGILADLLELIPVVSLGRDLSPLGVLVDPVEGIPANRMEEASRILGTGVFRGRLEEDRGVLERVRELRRKNQKIQDILDRYEGFWGWNSYVDPVKIPCDSSSVPETLPVKPVFTPRKEALESWIRIFRRWQKEGIQVVVVWLPMSGTWYRLAGTPLLHRKTGEILENLEHLFPEIPFLRVPPDLVSENEGDFLDITHLSFCGAKKVTDWIARRSFPPAVFPRPNK